MTLGAVNYKIKLMIKNRRINVISQLVFVAFIAYISLILLWGIILGYIAARCLCSEKRSWFLKIGAYKIKFHHWIVASAGLFVYFWISSVYNLKLEILGWHSFISGALGGIAFEDLWRDKKWYRIFYRNK